MIKTLRDAWNVPELRRKIVFTLFIIVLYRLGSVLPIPFVDQALASQASLYADSSLLSYFNMISGEAFSRATLFALSISPYITASIVMQLLAVAIPALEKLQKEGGEEGRKLIDKITRYVTVGLSLITAIGYYMYLNSEGYLVKAADVFPGAEGLGKILMPMTIVACYCAGASLIMWLGEKINENGIGNGISVILFINILSSVPGMVEVFYLRNRQPQSFFGDTYNAETHKVMDMPWFILLSIGVILFFVIAIAFLVHMTNAERRIKVMYAKRIQGRRMMGGQSSDLPIKLNMTGVMPIIFAQSIVSIPATIVLMTGNKPKWLATFANDMFSYTSWLYIIVFLVLIVAFGYFYVAISFNPIEIANNLKKNGGFVRGIRPGKPTSDYIQSITNRVTLLGSFFLIIVAAVPMLANKFLYNSLGIMAFGGTSLLIVVGVALETMHQLEAQLTTYRRPGGIFKKS